VKKKDKEGKQTAFGLVSQKRNKKHAQNIITIVGLILRTMSCGCLAG